MKISFKDKKIFIVLGFLVFAAIYYNLFYLKQQKEIKYLSANINSYEDISRKNEEVRLRVEGIDSELKIFNEKLKAIRTMFPPEITQEDVLMTTKWFSTESGLIIDNLSFSNTSLAGGKEAPTSETVDGSALTGTGGTGSSTAKEIKEEKFVSALDLFGILYGEPAPAPEPGKIFIPDGKGYVQGITVNAKGTTRQLKDFFHKIKSFKNKVSLKNIQINNDIADVLSVNFTLEFYGIMDRKAAKKGKYNGFEWTPLNPADKDDIFKPYEGYMVPNSQANSTSSEDNTKDNEEKLTDYDFSMRVLPFGANIAPPTVTFVGKSVLRTENKMPIIYGDNRGSEKIDLYLEALNGKYYCKFKTDHEAFPEATYVSHAEFKPLGEEIRFLIDSSKRVSTKDNSGAAINVTNRTGKKMIIDVVNDDENRPRVTIKKDENNVIINYK